MGSRHARSRADLARAQAEESVREAEARRKAAEQQRQELTSFLGTEAQFEDYNRVPVEYLERYQVDFESLGPLASTTYFGPSGAARLTEDTAQQLADEANAILDQAQEAAAAGDFAEADRLRNEAQTRLGTLHGAVNVGGRAYSAAPFAFNRIADPRQTALARATSTEGRIVGRRLQEALELQDTESEAFQRRRDLLYDPVEDLTREGTRQAERAIAAERRAVEANLRGSAGAGLGGAARAIGVETAQRRAAADAAANARASVYSQAAQVRSRALLQVNEFMLDFADRFSRQSVELAQSWVAGTAGVRDEFNAALDNLDTVQSELAFRAFEIYQEEYMEKLALEQAKEGQRDALISSGLQLAGAVGGFFLGGPAGAALGSQIGSIAGGAISGGPAPMGPTGGIA